MREYPGTVGVTADTLSCVVRDIAVMFCYHGFKKQIYLSGHGANKLPCELGFHKTWERYPDLKPVYWNWWAEAGLSHIHHADKGETEAALAVGSPVYMERVRDYSFEKPWHQVNSRFALQPDSGGINGQPSAADPAEGERLRERVITILTEKIHRAIAD
jgi:creatinine amidohydrolase